MADAYARSTGKTGVCLATSGPGATNLVTGIATAHMDSVPWWPSRARSGRLLGNDAFQEVDMTGISRPITKYSRQVKSVEDLPRAVREAFQSPAPDGPVPCCWISVSTRRPPNVVRARWSPISLPGYRPAPAVPKRQLAAAAGLINGSTARCCTSAEGSSPPMPRGLPR